MNNDFYKKKENNGIQLDWRGRYNKETTTFPTKFSKTGRIVYKKKSFTKYIGNNGQILLL